jgi:hypothetical protein
VYAALLEWMSGHSALETLRDSLTAVLSEQGAISENEVRTYSLFYYFHLREFIRAQRKSLVFGTLGYQQAFETSGNTDWIYQKNMQGTSFMEALLYDPLGMKCAFRMHDVFSSVFERERFSLAPRIEVWLDPRSLLQQSEPILGTIMLGTWSEELKHFMLENSPYREKLRRRGPRNFHYEDVLLEDIPFLRMAQRLEAMLRLVGEFDAG